MPMNRAARPPQQASSAIQENSRTETLWSFDDVPADNTILEMSDNIFLPSGAAESDFAFLDFGTF